MVLRKILLLMFFALLATVYSISQQVVTTSTPIKNISPANGEKMYVTYCAACHGIDGRGTGPAARSLKTKPTDLSVLAKQNNGKFPALHVQQLILAEGPITSSHGSKDMPVWQGLFYSLCSGKNMEEAEVHQRIVNLANHVATLQR
jgi:mono/diheme cytochrome c family protein